MNKKIRLQITKLITCHLRFFFLNRIMNIHPLISSSFRIFHIIFVCNKSEKFGQWIEDSVGVCYLDLFLSSIPRSFDDLPFFTYLFFRMKIIVSCDWTGYTCRTIYSTKCAKYVFFLFVLEFFDTFSSLQIQMVNMFILSRKLYDRLKDDMHFYFNQLKIFRWKLNVRYEKRKKYIYMYSIFSYYDNLISNGNLNDLETASASKRKHWCLFGPTKSCLFQTKANQSNPVKIWSLSFL